MLLLIVILTAALSKNNLKEANKTFINSFIS